jgi:CRP/FNR family transcriptional regulator, cyclic AMP receptor protein
MAMAASTLLERNRLFRGLPGGTIAQIATLSIRRPYPAGSIIFSQGDAGDALYGVITGRVRISASGPDGKEMFLNIMEPGDTFGEIALLDGNPRTAAASVMAPSELLIIARDPFLALLQREPQVAVHLLKLLCQRIRWTSGLAEDSALLALPARLARRLLSLGKQHGHDTHEGLHLKISQEEIARFLGASRQVVNQYLQDWKANGWVTLGRARLTIVDPQALERTAEQSGGDD